MSASGGRELEDSNKKNVLPLLLAAALPGLGGTDFFLGWVPPPMIVVGR
jgi:hypothetical protein